MIQTIKKYINSLAVVALLFVPLAVAVAAPAVVHAETNIQSSLCDGIAATGGSSDCTDTEGAQDGFNELVTLVINIFSIIVGVVSVIMIIIGGLKYITSSGDSNNVTGAKNTILYAIIGLVIVALAQFIVHFVLAKTIGASS